MTIIHVCVDTGNSGTKIIYLLAGESKARCLIMSSAIEVVSPKKLREYQERKSGLGCPAPERQAWLESAQQVVAVGALAEEFDPEDRRTEPKYEKALYKVLAALGAISQKHQLNTRKKLRLKLGVLLPWNEFSDKKRFQEKLTQLCEQYVFRGETLRVSLKKCVCHPEGGGLAATRLRLKGIEWFREHRLGFWMLGDRNFTGLCFEQGVLKRGDSPLLGFSFMLDRIIERTSCLSREQLTNALVEVQSEVQKSESWQRPNWGEFSSIQALATAQDPDLRQREVKDIVRVIESVIEEWEEKIYKWLGKTFPEPLAEVNVAGGPVLFFKPLIERYFNCSTESEEEWIDEGQPLVFGKPFTAIIWGAGIMKDVEQALSTSSQSSQKPQSLALRFVDEWGLFEYLLEADTEHEPTKSA